jgi:CheY-like chemotaxis protein
MHSKPVMLLEPVAQQPPTTAHEDQTYGVRPRMLIAHSDPVYGASCCGQFRRLGWEVELVSSAQQARLRVEDWSPAAVLLETTLPDESGWLTCKKLTLDRPDLKVVLLAAHATENGDNFAAFVGAAGLVYQAEGIAALVDEVYGTSLAAVG